MTAQPTIEDLDQIERILLEASAYGLRWEVQEWAKRYEVMHPNENPVKWYSMAFDEWIK
jgi:hypothetical protein